MSLEDTRDKTSRWSDSHVPLHSGFWLPATGSSPAGFGCDFVELWGRRFRVPTRGRKETK